MTDINKESDNYTLDELNKNIDEQQNAIIQKKKNTKVKTVKIIMLSFLVLVCIGILAIVAVLINNHNNQKIKNKCHQLARNGEFEEALKMADKIKFDDKEVEMRKNDIVTCSYLFDCKRAMEEYDKATFNKWFTQSGEYEFYKCSFYQVPILPDYFDYPYCVLSYYDYDDHETHYLYFDYDSEKKHYNAHDEVIGIEQDNSPDIEYSLDSDFDIKDAFWSNYKKEVHNALRSLIEIVSTTGEEIELEYSSIMWSMVSKDDVYKTAPLLDGYSTYHIK